MERKKYSGDSRTTQYRRKKELAGIAQRPHVVNCHCELHEQARNEHKNEAPCATSPDDSIIGNASGQAPTQDECLEYEDEVSEVEHEISHPEETDFNGPQEIEEYNVFSASCITHNKTSPDLKETQSVAYGCNESSWEIEVPTFHHDVPGPSHAVDATSAILPGDFIHENNGEDTLISSDISFHEEKTSISLHSSDIDSDQDNASSLSDDNDSSLSDLESFEAFFLEEDPQVAQHWDDYQPPVFNDQVDPNDPDDPDPGADDGQGDPEDSEDSDGEEEQHEDGALPDFNHAELQVPLVIQNQLNKGDFLLIMLASALRHNKTFTSLLDDFANLNVLYGHNFFPASKDKLYSILQLDRIAMKSHVYCNRKECGEYIGRKDRLGDIAVCRSCNTAVPTGKACFFVDLNFRNQLKRFLHIPGIWNHLQHRTTRQKAGSRDSIEDIYDGAYYKQLRLPGGPLDSPYSFSYVFNTDGCRPSKKGKLKVWPLFVRLNELPPAMRQRFHFLVALYVGKWDPNFRSFLKPFVAQANSLSTEGIIWKPDGVNEVNSTFIPLCHCVDAPARSGIHEMVSHGGNYGCTYCTHAGLYDHGAVRFPPFLPNGQVAFEDRTHAGMLQDMLQAHNLHNNHMGHRGLTQLMLLDHFDLREGQAADDLHPDHEGCAKHITDLLLSEAPRVNRNLYQVDILQLINQRLLSIKTPSRIARKPTKINGSFNGSEWRNWLLFYGPPCLFGIIDDEYVKVLSQLSHACYLLSLDVIEPHDLNEAERLLETFARNVYEKFGLPRMKFNVHVTSAHKVRSVRQLGPPWSYSTYNFESLNSKLLKKITSPKGSLVQVVTRYLLQQTVTCAMYSEEVPEAVRLRLHEISSKRRLQRVRQIGMHSYAIGKEITRRPSHMEAEVLARENHHVLQFNEYKSALLYGTRYWSDHHREEDVKSDDSFIYTKQDTFCTIKRIIAFRNDMGEEHFGVMVVEHDVARHFEVACHIAILRNAEADLLHYISADVIKCPAIKMNFDGIVYAVPLPNCHEID